MISARVAHVEETSVPTNELLGTDIEASHREARRLGREARRPGREARWLGEVLHMCDISTWRTISQQVTGGPMHAIRQDTT